MIYINYRIPNSCLFISLSFFNYWYKYKPKYRFCAAGDLLLSYHKMSKKTGFIL